MTKTVLVTGVSRGIGRTIADRCISEGYRVIGVARSEPENFSGIFRPIDLNDVSAKERFKEIADEFAPTRLVANAGFVAAGPIEGIEDDDFETTIRVNVQSSLWAIRALLSAMRSAKNGRIVLLGSRASLGKAGRTSYSASKAALNGVARTGALELGIDGITINVVSPGPVETDMFTTLQPEGSARRQAIIDASPMRRVGRPEEVAAAVSFFLSEDAGYVTGQNLFVCGGASLGG